MFSQNRIRCYKNYLKIDRYAIKVYDQHVEV